MRLIVILGAINIMACGLLITLAPGTHFSWPNSYKFWWFDDLPWAALLISIAAVALLAIPNFRTAAGARRIAPVLAVTLLALLPYVACSGGGV